MDACLHRSKSQDAGHRDFLPPAEVEISYERKRQKSENPVCCGVYTDGGVCCACDELIRQAGAGERLVGVPLPEVPHGLALESRHEDVKEVEREADDENRPDGDSVPRLGADT